MDMRGCRDIWPAAPPGYYHQQSLLDHETCSLDTTQTQTLHSKYNSFQERFTFTNYIRDSLQILISIKIQFYIHFVCVCISRWFLTLIPLCRKLLNVK